MKFIVTPSDYFSVVDSEVQNLSNSALQITGENIAKLFLAEAVADSHIFKDNSAVTGSTR